MLVRIAVLPGDGIGPEVVAEAVKVLGAVAQRFGHTFEFEEALVGGAAIDATGHPLPDETMALCQASDAVLFGAVGGPKWDDPRAKVRPEQALLALRKGLGLFANLRPVKVMPALAHTSPLRPELLEGVDLVVVRELTGGIYFGQPSERRVTAQGREAVDTMHYTEAEVARLMRVAFELARGRRHKITSVDKANVLSASRLWREVAHEVAAEYPDVEYEDLLVDAAAMHLIRRPADFDVIATSNLFGDILTDEASMLVGSMGMLPSASLAGIKSTSQQGMSQRGTSQKENSDLADEPANPQSAIRNSQFAIRNSQFGLYEPIHGSAPDIAGQGIANPLAAILSAAMMLRYSFGLEAEAAAIEEAVERALADGYRTHDILDEGGRLVSTREMGELIVGHVMAIGD